MEYIKPGQFEDRRRPDLNITKKLIMSGFMMGMFKLKVTKTRNPN